MRKVVFSFLALLCFSLHGMAQIIHSNNTGATLIQPTVTQGAHGFIVGDAVRVASLTVTADNTTDTFTATVHGFVNGQSVTFTSSGTLPAGVAINTPYYIIGATANTFQVSLTSGGAAVNFTTNGTPTILAHYWKKSLADSAANAEVYGVVGSVTTETFTLSTSGLTTISSANHETGATIVPGTVYYLSGTVAGKFTAVDPNIATATSVSKPYLQATTTTAGYVANFRGLISGGGGAASTFLNGGVTFGNGSGLIQDVPNLFFDNASDRLGVGTNAPASKIHVTGDGNASPNNAGVRLENNGTLGRSFMVSSRSDGGITRLAFSDETATAERISLGINGFTGFGEINPQARLHLKGDGNGSPDNVAIRFQSDGGSGRTWNVGTRGDGGTQRFFISDETGAAERFGIDSTGRTWIGQGAAPQLIPGYGNAGLNVISIAGSDAMNIKGPGANNALNIYNPTGGDTTLISFITDDGGTNEKGRIRYNSSDLIGGNVIQYLTTSDQRLKTDTGRTAKGLADLLKIKVRNYNWKSGGNADGFFAQELYKVVPSAVSVGGDELDANGNLKNPWSVDYGKLSPILVQAVQDLTAKVQALESQLRSAKSRSSRVAKRKGRK